MKNEICKLIGALLSGIVTLIFVVCVSIGLYKEACREPVKKEAVILEMDDDELLFWWYYLNTGP